MRAVMKAQVGRGMRDARKLRRQVEKIHKQAAGSAMGRASSSARTAGRRAVSSAANVKQKAIKPRLNKSRVEKRVGVVRVRVWFRGGLMPAEAVGAPRQTKKGVRVGRQSYSGAFLAEARRGRAAGKTAVFKRDGKPRGPISRQGIDLNQFSDDFKRAAKRAFWPVYRKRFEHEVHRRMVAKGLK